MAGRRMAALAGEDRNDIVDCTYAAYATYFQGLLSDDAGANEIYAETRALHRSGHSAAMMSAVRAPQSNPQRSRAPKRPRREGDHGPAAAAGGLARKQRRIGEELCHGLADRARVARAQLVLMRHQEVDLSLGEDHGHRPEPLLLSPPMQRNAFHIRHVTLSLTLLRVTVMRYLVAGP
jgi:hypothetical protein